MLVVDEKEILIRSTGSASGVIERVAGLDLMAKRRNDVGEGA